MTLPMVQKMVEEIQFECVNDHKTLIYWYLFFELATWLKPFNQWLKRRVFRQMFTAFAKGLTDYADAYPEPRTQTTAFLIKQVV